jgi:Holliday junction resolvase RusA-like endonuclease
LFEAKLFYNRESSISFDEWDSAKIYVPIKPVPKQSFRQSKNGGYQSKRVKEYEAKIAAYVSRVIHEKFPTEFKKIPRNYPIAYQAYYLFAPSELSAKSASRAGEDKESLYNKLMNKGKYGDTDNLTKAVHDAAQRVLFEDDKAIYASAVNRFYHYEDALQIEYLWLKNIKNYWYLNL